MKPIGYISLLIAFGTLSLGAQAQNVMVLVNKQYVNKLDALLNTSPQQIVLEPGLKIVIERKGSKKKRKGEIESFLFPKFVVVKRKHINLSSVEKISFMDGEQHLKKILGPVVIGLGAGCIGLGYYLGNRGIRSLFEPDKDYAYQVTPISMASAVVGIGVAIVGSHFIFSGAKMTVNGFQRKKINLAGEKWSYSIVDMKKFKETMKKEESLSKKKKGKGGRNKRD